MKKNLLVVLLLIFSTGLYAQWDVFDGNSLPGDNTPSFGNSCNNPGPNTMASIVPDLDIPGNNLLDYLSPDVDGRMAYKIDFTTWTGSDFTAVVRMRGYPGIDTLTYLFDIEIRNGNAGLREKLFVKYDNTIELDNSNASADLGYDVHEWHIYRITMSGANVSVYVDESTTPIISGVTTNTTSDLQFKVADCSGGNSNGAQVDWMAWTTEGAYAPGSGPALPGDLFTGGGGNDFNASDYSIAFLTKEVNDLGAIEEQGLITDLRQRGFTVDVTYNNTVQYTTDFDFSFDALNDYDLVILGRGVSSGDFTDAADWAAVETPIITFSAYLMRSSRLQLINSASASREVADGTTVDVDRVTNVTINDAHPVFNGMDMDMDGEIEYLTWFYDYIAYGADTFEMNHNATLLATLKHDMGPGDGTVAMAYWDAGVETYPGGPVLAGKRATFLMGSDDNSTPKLRNFTAFTDESTIAFHNLIKYLLGLDPDGVEIPLSGPIAQYHMDGTGETVVDAFGGANGTIMNGNGITREDCGIINSINFAGATADDAVIWVEDNPTINFDGSSSFTLSIWAKVDPITNTDEMTLLLKGDNGMSLPNGNGHWYALATKDNELRFTVDDDVTKTELKVAIDDMIFPPAEWNHIAGVMDTDQDSLFLYLNGAKIGSILNETDMDMSTTDLPMVIGNYHSSNRRINGSVDELGIYDRALDDDAIAMLFANASPTNVCTVLETIAGANNDATLSNLTVDAGTLDPVFASNIFDYTVEVPAGTTQIVLVPTPNDPNAIATGGGVFSPLPGTATITVTAEDGITTQDYTVSIDVTSSTNDLSASKIALTSFPNPFEDEINFSFHLEDATEVNLTIYDLMGKEIQTVINDRLTAGDHSINISTEHLQTGVYLYKFNSGDVNVTHKVIKSNE